MAGAGPDAVRLALSLLKGCHGDACELVVSNLLKRGPQTLKEIARGTKFPHLADCSPKERSKETDRIVRAVLVAMLQFSLVKTHRIQPEPTARNLNPEPYWQYEADVYAILRIHRIPFYYNLLDDRFPGISSERESPYKAILKVLVENGRLRFDQIVLAVTAKLQLEKGEAESQVSTAFNAMLLEHLVERAPPCDLPPPPPPSFPRRVGRRPSAAKPGTEKAVKEDLEKQQQEVTKQYMETRYKPQATPTATAQPAETTATAKPKRRKKVPAASVGQKVQATPAQNDSAQKTPGEPAAPEAEPDVWQVSHSTFTRFFRYQACADFIERQQGPRAGKIVRAMLRASPPPLVEGVNGEHWSASVSPDEVDRHLRLLGDKEEEEDDTLDAIMMMMREDPDLLRKDTSRSETAFGINLGKIVEKVKLLELQGAIRGRFGLQGVLVWNTVLEGKQMEPKRIHESALLPHNDVNRLVFEMFRAGFLAMQDIPRSPDHAPSKTFYTFKVDLPAALNTLLARQLRGVANIRDRRTHELKKRREVVAAMERVDLNFLEDRKSDVRAMQRIKEQLDVDALAMQSVLVLLLGQ